MSDRDEYIYRFEYADKSAFVITEEGRAFVERPDGRREEKTGKVSNRIRAVIGMAVKPRQDLIYELAGVLDEVRDFLASGAEIVAQFRGKAAADPMHALLWKVNAALAKAKGGSQACPHGMPNRERCSSCNSY